jgi:hypothetical protein
MKPNQPHLPQTTRREFARTAIRTVLLGGIVAVGAVLARRACNARGTCSNCTLLANCALPWRKENS